MLFQGYKAIKNKCIHPQNRQGQQRAKFFDDARGSAFEWAACLDASVAKGFVSIDRVRTGKKCLPVS